MKYLTLLLGFLFSLSLFAETNRQRLTTDIFEKVNNIKKEQKSIRVYIHRKIKIYRNNVSDSNVSVDDKLNVKVYENKLKEVIGRNTPGKIIDIKGNEQTHYKSIEDAIKNLTTIYVTFDPTCEKIECAFVFQQLLKDIDWSGRPSFYYNQFYLVKIPKNTAFNNQEIHRISPWWSRLIGEERNQKPLKENYLYKNKGYSVVLEYKLSELKVVSKEVKRYKGIKP